MNPARVEAARVADLEGARHEVAKEGVEPERTGWSMTSVFDPGSSSATAGAGSGSAGVSGSGFSTVVGRAPFSKGGRSGPKLSTPCASMA